MSHGIRRKDAARMGLATYDGGKACPSCMTRERYTTSSNCVMCTGRGDNYKGVSRTTGDAHDRKANADAWRAAQVQGARTYHRISECRKCSDLGDPGQTLRYTSSGGCVLCMKRKSSQQWQERKTAEPGQAAHPIIPQASNCGHVPMMETLFPDMKGRTMMYAEHRLFHHITTNRNSHHYGKCVCCYPDRAVMMVNILRRAVEIPVEFQATWHILSRLSEHTTLYPHGYLEHCKMAKLRGANNPQPYVPEPPTLPTLNLPKLPGWPR